MSHILEIHGLVKTQGSFTLKDVTFSLESGYVMGFLGRNGAGKTTTLDCLMGLRRFDAGEIRLFGSDVRDELALKRAKEHIGYVSEEPAFYEDFTVAWTGGFTGRFYERWDDSIFRSMCERLDIDPKKKVGELSKGMKTKLQLAIALAHRPGLLILDEPTSGLDPAARRELTDIFQEFLIEGDRGILFSSHITQDIERIADYITIIKNGEILLSRDKEHVLDEYRLVKADVNHIDENLSSLLLGSNRNDAGIAGITDSPDEFERRFTAEREDAMLVMERPDLESIFIHLTGGDR